MPIRRKPNLKGGVIYEKIYEMTLYPDSSTYNCEQIIGYIMLDFENWAYIKHDKDTIEETGEIKKEHIHLLFRNKDRLSINSVAKKYGVPVNDIVWKANWQYAVQYLVHYNHPEKYQYDISDIVSSYGEDIKQFFKAKSLEESEQVLQLYNYIFEQRISTMHDLLKYSLENNCYSALRRGATLFRDLLRENQRWLQDEKLNKLHEEFNSENTDC